MINSGLKGLKRGDYFNSDPCQTDRQTEIRHLEDNSRRPNSGGLKCIHFHSVAWLNNPYSAGIDFIHQNLTSVDDLRTLGVQIFLMSVELK